MSLVESSLRPSKASSTILPLPTDAVAQIKSSSTITSLCGVMCGLLENALDAQATKIEISIDFYHGNCMIEDNGLGIHPSEFDKNGCLGHMYHTSKQDDTLYPELHGGTGTFLASLAALSLVTITSRHHEHYSHNTLVMHQTNPVMRLLPAPIQHHIRGFTHGTRVTVRDLFGNMPVRVKQRAMLAYAPLEVEKCWQSMKQNIIALLLPWKIAVAVKVVDARDRARCFSITSNAGIDTRPLREKDMNTMQENKFASIQRNAVSILAQAGYSLPVAQGVWVPVSVSALPLSVKGTISLDPSPSKAVQFISIGVMPCNKEAGYHDLYDAINRAFDQSSFGRTEDDPEVDEAELKRRNHDRRYKINGPTNKQLKGGGKGVDRWPKFSFCIELKHNGHKYSKASESLLRTIVDILEALAFQWLEANHFRPRKRKRKVALAENRMEYGSTASSGVTPLQVESSCARGEASDKPPGLCLELPDSSTDLSGTMNNEADRRLRSGAQVPQLKRPLSQTHFSDWSRIKSGKAANYDSIWKCKNPLGNPITRDQTPTAVDVHSSVSRELDSRLSPPKQEQHTRLQAPGSSHTQDPPSMVDAVADEYIDWTNPITKQQCRINTRTGVVLPRAQRISRDVSSLSQQPVAISTDSPESKKCSNLARRGITVTDGALSPWLKDLLKDWESPVFKTQAERPISVAALHGSGHRSEVAKHACSNHDTTHSFLQAGQGSTNRLSKKALEEARVISQVDQKFILLKMPSVFEADHESLDSSMQSLVLVDQHAASERCVLEDLLRELCSPDTNPQKVRSVMGNESGVKTTRLDRAVYYQISKHESSMFQSNASHFARWGILYDIQKTQRHGHESNESESQLRVITLPPGIAERCRVEPKLLIELLRSEIHTLAESPSSSNHIGRSAPDTNNAHFWLGQIGSCPKGIINMLNSRACRSAIMFNDKLSVMECRELIDKLTRCAFPFMCAHGRVSMVPVICFSGHNDRLGPPGMNVFKKSKKHVKEHSFGDAFRQWRARKDA